MVAPTPTMELNEDAAKAQEKLQPKEKTGDNAKDAERRP
jgi:hypothetical protein